MKYERLGNIIEISKGKKHNQIKEPTLKSTRIIGINDLRNDNDIIFTNDNIGIEACENDILIAWDGANAGTIGYGKKGYIGSTISRLRVKDIGRYYTPFIGMLLQSKFEYLRATATGTTIPHINRIALTSIKVPSFNFSDQIRIATVLARMENMIAKRKDSIKLIDELLQSTFLEMFGPRNKDYRHWEIVEIKDLAANYKGSMRTGPFGSNLLHSQFTEIGDVAVLGIDNAVQNKFSWGQRRYITMEKYSELSAYRVFPGDVIITIMGTIGRAAVIPDDIPLAINTKHLAAITFDRQKANPKFMAYSIHSSPYIIKQFASKNHGAIMNGLNLGLIKETKLRRPPIELQNQFATFLEKVEAIKARYIQSLTELESLYDSLSQRAFNGELDLSKISIDVAIKTEVAIDETNNLEITSAINFSQGELTEIIKTLSDQPFSFNELWKKVEQAPFESAPEYDEIKGMIYTMLKGKNPALKQSFEEILDDTTGEMVKKIVLRVTV